MHAAPNPKHSDSQGGNKLTPLVFDWKVELIIFGPQTAFCGLERTSTVSLLFRTPSRGHLSGSGPQVGALITAGCDSGKWMTAWWCPPKPGLSICTSCPTQVHHWPHNPILHWNTQAGILVLVLYLVQVMVWRLHYCGEGKACFLPRSRATTKTSKVVGWEMRLESKITARSEPWLPFPVRPTMVLPTNSHSTHPEDPLLVSSSISPNHCTGL